MAVRTAHDLPTRQVGRHNSASTLQVWTNHRYSHGCLTALPGFQGNLGGGIDTFGSHDHRLRAGFKAARGTGLRWCALFFGPWVCPQNLGPMVCARSALHGLVVLRLGGVCARCPNGV